MEWIDSNLLGPVVTAMVLAVIGALAKGWSDGKAMRSDIDSNLKSITVDYENLKFSMARLESEMCKRDEDAKLSRNQIRASMNLEMTDLRNRIESISRETVTRGELSQFTNAQMKILDRIQMRVDNMRG